MLQQKLNDEIGARERIMRVATVLFAKDGLEGTSTRSIAKASGVNISLISYYFGGKDGLYRQVVIEFANQVQAEFEKYQAHFDLHNVSKQSFAKEMRMILFGMISIKQANPYIHILLQREALSGLPICRDIYDGVFSQLGEKIVGMIQRAQAKKFVRSDLNPHVHFLSMVHAVDNFLIMNGCETKFQKHCPQLPAEIESYSAEIFKIFIEGVML